MVGPVERNPVKTALLTVVTAGLSPAIFAIGGLVATIAAGIFALIAMTLTLVEILALREIYLKNQARNAINELELAGSLSPKESAHMKELVAQSGSDKVLCDYLIPQLQNSEKFSSEEISGFTQLSNTGRALVKIQLQVSKKMNDATQKELKEAIGSLENSSFKKQLKTSLGKQNKTAFRKAMISHFREIANTQKAKGNHVDAYMKFEWAQTIESASAQDVFVTFMRLDRQQNLYTSLNEKLNGKLNELQNKVTEYQKKYSPIQGDEGPEEYEENSRVQKTSTRIQPLIKSFQTLHAESAQLLNNHRFISEEPDYLFALYRGNFTQKFRLINDILKALYPQHKQSFTELPLSPKGEMAAGTTSPVGKLSSPIKKVKAKIAEIHAKLDDKEKSGLLQQRSKSSKINSIH